ncbi:ABC transporter permease [Deinococcus radiotolerans]|uniref:Autoinducer 2 import system permease protein LsrD n=1 Tax=Deinococcus radiotolerans TaxID=1309407 RepID=A0ABQ2FP38_9DEIO|nr:ABC transporter permease [Deinococcus radiotolerans]GGL12837.1 ABC transporter permease [Deinococcus radiotolerans]
MSVPNRPKRSLLGWEATILALVALALLLGSTLSDAFLTAANLSNLSSNLVEIALIALTMTLIVIAAEIDLSVASIAGMCSALLGVLWAAHVPMPLAIVLTLGLGTLAGFFNGWLVTRLGLPSLAVTIGTLALYRGLAYALLGDRAVADFPPFWTNLGFGLVPGTQIPIPIVAFVLLAALTAVVLHATPFGRSLYAIGSNEVAARFAGLRVERTKLLLFTLSGLMSAFAAVVYTFRFSSARADNANGLELSVIAAVLLGGVSIFGGRGSVIGVIAAVFLIGIIQNALTLADVPNEILTIVTGLLLILSVLGPNLSAQLKAAYGRRGRAAKGGAQ